VKSNFRQAQSVRLSKPETDPAFDMLVDAYGVTLDNFARLRGWRTHGGQATVDPEALRVAARALRAAVDEIASMPAWVSDAEPTGASLDAKERIIGELMVDSVVHNEPWLAELAMRLATKAVAAHPDEFGSVVAEEEAVF
jgi:hypothetical protein